MTQDLPDKDKKDWENFITSGEKLLDKDQKQIQKKFFKTKSIDLHGFTLEDANKAIKKFIEDSYSENVNKIVVVTGKGLHSQNENDPYVSKDLSILKHSIPDFIKKNNNLMDKIIDLKEADIKDGGSGAFYIYLKKLK